MFSKFGKQLYDTFGRPVDEFGNIIPQAPPSGARIGETLFFQYNGADISALSFTAAAYSDQLDTGVWQDGSILLKVSAAATITVEASADGGSTWFYYNNRTFATGALTGLIKLDKYVRFLRITTDTTVTTTAQVQLRR